MKQEWKDKWVAALKSGNYEQGTGCLRNKDRFCCLGVLCDIINKELEVGKWDNKYFNNNDHYVFRINDTIDHGGLPLQIQEIAGIGSRSGSINYINKKYETLSYLNDKGSTFEQIAEIIEENWSEL